MPKFAANLTMLFTEIPFLERFAAAAEAGFEAVEFLFPYEFDPADLVAQLETNRLTSVLHNLPAGDWGKGERGIAIFPDRVSEFRAGVDRAIAYATALGCPQVNCLAGVAPANADRLALRQTFVENLKYASDRLGEAGIRLLIEPINTRDIPCFFLNRTADASNLIDEVGFGTLKIQHDLYHMQVMEGDLALTIERYLPRIGHIQIADTPGRHEPGTGEIHFPFLFAFLDRVGYDGWIGCEYRPSTTTAESLGWFAPYRTEATA